MDRNAMAKCVYGSFFFEKKYRNKKNQNQPDIRKFYYINTCVCAGKTVGKIKQIKI